MMVRVLAASRRGGALPVIMSIIRSSRNPRLPQLQPLSARYNLIKKQTYPGFLSSVRPHARRVALSTSSPCLLEAVGRLLYPDATVSSTFPAFFLRLQARKLRSSGRRYGLQLQHQLQHRPFLLFQQLGAILPPRLLS